MKKHHEYLRHAADVVIWRVVGATGHRQQLQQMAETWEQLAENRKRQLEKQANRLQTNFLKISGSILGCDGANSRVHKTLFRFRR